MNYELVNKFIKESMLILRGECLFVTIDRFSRKNDLIPVIKFHISQDILWSPTWDKVLTLYSSSDKFRNFVLSYFIEPHRIFY